MNIISDKIYKVCLQSNYTYNVIHSQKGNKHYYKLIYSNLDETHNDGYKIIENNITKSDYTMYNHNEPVLGYIYPIEYLEEEAKKNIKQKEHDDAFWVRHRENMRFVDNPTSFAIYYPSEFIVIDYLYDPVAQKYKHLYCCKKKDLYYYKVSLKDYEKCDLIKKYTQPYFFNDENCVEDFIDVSNDFGSLYPDDSSFFGLQSYKKYKYIKK